MMRIREIAHSLRRELDISSSWDRKLAFVFAVLVILRSAFNVAYHSGFSDGLSTLGATWTDLSHMMVAVNLGISVGFVVFTLGLWLRKPVGVIFSLLSLLWVCVVYVWWHFETLDYLSDLPVGTDLYNRRYQDLGFFHGATRWDSLVLILSLLLLVWQVKLLINILRASRVRSPESGSSQ